MATFRHGREQRLYAGGYDLSAYFRAFNLEAGVSDADTTVFTDSAKRSLPGVSEASASGEGIFHEDPLLIRDILKNALGTEGAYVVSMSSDTAGVQGFALPAYLAKWGLNFPQDDIVDLQVEWSASNAYLAPYCLIEGSTQRTAALNGTQVDLGAGTHGKVLVISHLTALTGFTAVTVKVQHKANVGDAWTDLVTLANHTAAGSQKTATATGPILRYARAVTTVTGASGTYNISTSIAIDQP